jgi:hypothetical protein
MGGPGWKRKAPRLPLAARFDKLASNRPRRHNHAMRKILTAAALLLLAGCATTPIPVVTPDPAPATTAPPQRGGLIGLDANELATRFGRPRLQVREGDGTKLQFGGGSCLLDAYLYPPPGGGGVARVTHVDTRNRDGGVVAQADCIAMIEAR